MATCSFRLHDAERALSVEYLINNGPEQMVNIMALGGVVTVCS